MSFFGFDTKLPPKDGLALEGSSSNDYSKIDELMESKYAFGIDQEDEEIFEDLLEDNDELNEETFGGAGSLDTDFDFTQNQSIIQSTKEKEPSAPSQLTHQQVSSVHSQKMFPAQFREHSSQPQQLAHFPPNFPAGVPHMGSGLPPMGFPGFPGPFHQHGVPGMPFPQNMLPPHGSHPAMVPGIPGAMPQRPLTAQEIEAMMRQQAMMARQQPPPQPQQMPISNITSVQELEALMRAQFGIQPAGVSAQMIKSSPPRNLQQQPSPQGPVLQSGDFPPLGMETNGAHNLQSENQQRMSLETQNLRDRDGHDQRNRLDGNRGFQNQNRQRHNNSGDHNRYQRDHRGGRRDQQQVQLISQEILDELEDMDDLERMRVREANLPREERYRGLMRDREKNLVAKIQISQLVTADPYADDFYYQIFTALKGDGDDPALDNNQRDRRSGRRAFKPGKGNSYMVSNFMQQQLKKSIEERKLKPREGTLALEGALGKISSTSIRNPKKAIQLASFPASASGEMKPSISMMDMGAIDKPLSSKAVLKSVENVYSAVLHLEQLGRKVPGNEGEKVKWDRKFSKYVQMLWSSLHVGTNVPTDVTHPTVAFVNYPKGVTVLPRALGFLRPDQVYNVYRVLLNRLECLEVMNMPCGSVSDKIDTFMTHVIPPLVTLLGDASLKTVNAMTKILLERHNLLWMAKSRIGLSILTILLSRAEILKQGSPSPEEMDLNVWGEMYAFMFQSLQGHFAELFPTAGDISFTEGQDDVYVWQFLSALAVGSGTVQYQLTLVSEVRENAIAASKSGDPKAIDNINLFLNALGLQIDATQLAATLA